MLSFFSSSSFSLSDMKPTRLMMSDIKMISLLLSSFGWAKLADAFDSTNKSKRDVQISLKWKYKMEFSCFFFRVVWFLSTYSRLYWTWNSIDRMVQYFEFRFLFDDFDVRRFFYEFDNFLLLQNINLPFYGLFKSIETSNFRPKFINTTPIRCSSTIFTHE